MDQLTDFVISFAEYKNLNPDCFYGVAEGASKLGALTQFKWAKQQSDYAKGSHVLAMGRGKVKEHGAAKDKYFLGMPRGQVVVMEDVTTTGMSLLACLDQLKAADVKVIAAIGLTNRMEKRDDGSSVQEAVEAMGIPYHYMSNALELLPKVIQAHTIPEKTIEEIKKEFKEFGVQALNV